jgi:2-haloacid dehalogenase
MTALLSGIRACVFDAYGTLFDFNSAARQAQDALGPAWQQLSEVWRTKQLQYTWLRSLMRRHLDFWKVTGDALDFAMSTMGIDDPTLRERLMGLYLQLDAYPEVDGVLRGLKESGRRCAILSNGTPAMLAAAVSNAGIAERLDAVLSVEDVGVFKPDPRVYQLAIDRLGLPAREICFVSSNAWDAFAAKAFGMRVVWCNRFGQAPERIPELPDAQVTRLSELPALLGTGPARPDVRPERRL